MLTVAENNLPLVIVALLIGVAIAFWLFKAARRGSSDGVAPASAPAAARLRDGREGNALSDEISAAARDVAGEIIGVDAHPHIPPAGGPADNLQILKGVGPKLAAQLNENGITRFDQLAGLSANEVALLDERMGAFSGRVARDRLVEQACYLARGDKDGFEATFGKLGSA